MLLNKLTVTDMHILLSRPYISYSNKSSVLANFIVIVVNTISVNQNYCDQELFSVIG